MRKRSNFTPMNRFHEIIDHYGLKLMEAPFGTNVPSGNPKTWEVKRNVMWDLHRGENIVHSANTEGRKLFDYYPLRMKLFDYRQWQQLTYPSLLNGTDKWETELDGIIQRLLVSPQ